MSEALGGADIVVVEMGDEDDGASKIAASADVRKRPGMFVGETEDGGGVLNMLLEVLANVFDQHLAGRCSRASVHIAADGTITVEDDGPGMASEGGAGLPPLKEMLSQLSTRPTVDGHRPHAHLGRGGLGLFVVNALSERLELRTVRDGALTTVLCSRGEIIEAPTTVATTEPPGTRVRFRPDPQIFRHVRVPRAELTRELEDLSFLAPRFALSWTIAGDALATHGLAGRVAMRVPCELGDVAAHTGTYVTASGPVEVDVALGWNTSPWYAREAEIDSFVNLGRTKNDGTHVGGLNAGIRAFLGSGKGQHKQNLVAAVSVVLADVTYGAPTKSRLVSGHAAKPVKEATVTALEKWAAARPELAAAIRARS